MSASRPRCLGVEGSCLPHEKTLPPPSYLLPTASIHLRLLTSHNPAAGPAQGSCSWSLLDQPRGNAHSSFPSLLALEVLWRASLTGWGCPQLCWAPRPPFSSSRILPSQDSPWWTEMGCLIIPQEEMKSDDSPDKGHEEEGWLGVGKTFPEDLRLP